MQHLIKGEFPLEVRLREEFLGITTVEPLTICSPACWVIRSAMHYPPMLRGSSPGRPSIRCRCTGRALLSASGELRQRLDFRSCPITEECGGVNVLPGSHRLRVPHQGR